MKSFRPFIIGLLTGVFFASPFVVFASDVNQKVEAYFGKFNFVINGELKYLEADPLVYQGTTYLPVRVVANMLGYDVTYRSDSRTIEMNSTQNISDKGGINLQDNQPAQNIVSNSNQFNNLEWDITFDNFSIHEPDNKITEHYPDVTGFITFDAYILIPQDFDLTNKWYTIYGDIDGNFYRLREELGRKKYPLQHGLNKFNFRILLRNTTPNEILFKIVDNQGNIVADFKRAVN